MTEDYRYPCRGGQAILAPLRAACLLLIAGSAGAAEEADRFADVKVTAEPVRGSVRDLETVLRMVPADIRVIPGHGPLTDKAAIRKSHDMTLATRAVAREGVDEGLDADAIVARGLPAEWAGVGTGFINEERWIRILLSDVSRTDAP